MNRMWTEVRGTTVTYLMVGEDVFVLTESSLTEQGKTPTHRPAAVVGEHGRLGEAVPCSHATMKGFT